MIAKRQIIRLPRVGSAFAHGMARVVDINGSLNDYDIDELLGMYYGLCNRRRDRPSGLEAETESMRMVWTGVGASIRTAIRTFESEDSDAHLAHIGQGSIEQLE